MDPPGEVRDEPVGPWYFSGAQPLAVPLPDGDLSHDLLDGGSSWGPLQREGLYLIGSGIHPEPPCRNEVHRRHSS